MNWFMALKVACWLPVAASPDAWVRPAGVKLPYAA